MASRKSPKRKKPYRPDRGVVQLTLSPELLRHLDQLGRKRHVHKRNARADAARALLIADYERTKKTAVG